MTQAFNSGGDGQQQGGSEGKVTKLVFNSGGDGWQWQLTSVRRQ